MCSSVSARVALLKVDPSILVLTMQAGGMHGPFLQKLLRDSNPEQVLIKTLLIISQLARIARTGNEVMAGNYELIHRADIYGLLRKLFSHSDPGVRMRLCSLIGMGASKLFLSTLLSALCNQASRCLSS